MARRIAQKLNIMFGDDIVKANINIQAQKIKFKLNISGYRAGNIDLENPDVEPTPVPYSFDQEDYELSLDVFKQTNNLKANTLYALITSYHFSDKQLGPKNILNLSNITKTNRVENAVSLRLPSLNTEYYICIFVKDPNGTFEDHDIIVNLPSNIQAENITSNVVLETPQSFSHVELVDSITITEDTNYSNSEYYKFNVASEPYVDEVFLEPVCGIVDRVRVSMTNGSGSFRVLKSSLESGDTLKVKAGFYSYPGMASITKTV